MSIGRRKFIGAAAAGSTALLLSSLDSLAEWEVPAPESAPHYELRIMATNWGFQGSMDDFCAKAKQAGYDGIEVWWPNDKVAQDALFAALKKYGLEIGFLCGVPQSDPAAHAEAYKKMLAAVVAQPAQRPLYINNHSGRDYFRFEDNAPLIEYANGLAKESGLLICHETHRGRMMYAAHVTKQFLDRYPDLKLTLDISHWCNVHESMLADQPENLALALERTEHIHARIGHPEGPQINDPRAPEWESTVKQHLLWWDKVVERKKQRGERITFLTEFGPPDYMPTMPYSRKPLADLWEVNVHMMQLLRKRYSGK